MELPSRRGFVSRRSPFDGLTRRHDSRGWNQVCRQFAKCLPIRSEDRVRSSAHRQPRVGFQRLPCGRLIQPQQNKPGGATLRKSRVSRTIFRPSDPKAQLPWLSPKAVAPAPNDVPVFPLALFHTGDFSSEAPKDSVHVSFRCRRRTVVRHIERNTWST